MYTHIKTFGEKNCFIILASSMCAAIFCQFIHQVTTTNTNNNGFTLYSAFIQCSKHFSIDKHKQNKSTYYRHNNGRLMKRQRVVTNFILPGQ